MAALENARHERFAQEIAKGKPASEAYTLAGYAYNEGNAIRLKGNEKVSARVAEILERGAVRAEVTVATITANLMRISEKAEALSEASGLAVARAAQVDIAKVNGLVVDKLKVDATISHEEALDQLG